MLIRVGFYQFNPLFGEKERNLEKVESALLETDADLVVLPELFQSGYQFVDREEVDAIAEEIPGGVTTELLRDVSRKKNMYIVGGLAERAGDDYFNSAVFVGPEGFIGHYRKTHLFYEEKLFFKSGDTGFRVWQTGIGKIGIMICFDWFFPEAMRTLAVMGAEVVAHPSNLVLPYCPRGMPTRCLENMVFGITANRTGVERRKAEELRFIGSSQVVSPLGEVLLKAGGEEEVASVVEIDTERARNKDLNHLNNIFQDRKPQFYNLT